MLAAILTHILSAILEVTRQTIIALEQEKDSPSLELAFRIARVFGEPLEEVFSYQGEKESKE